MDSAQSRGGISGTTQPSQISWQQNSYARANFGVDPGEKAVGASTFNYLGKRIHSDSRKDSESSKVQRRKQTPLLNPFLGIWEEHDIVTCAIHKSRS